MISRVVVAAAVVVLLSSCAGPSTPEVEAPSPDPTPTTVAAAFDGDCGAIFSSADLTRILGTEMSEPTTYDPTDALLTPVYVLGGTMCLWNGADENAYLEIAVLPTDTATDAPYCYGTDGDARCSFESSASGLSLSAVVYGATGMATTALDAGIVELTSLFADAAATAEPVTPFTRPDDAWPASTDCADLDEATSLAALLDAPGLTADSGNGGAELPPGVYDAEAELGLASCYWQPADYDKPAGDVGMLDVTVLPGAATSSTRAAVEALDGATPLDVDGTDGAVHVVTTDNGVDLDFYWLFSGSNALRISGDATEDQLLAAAGAVIDAENASRS